MGFLDWLTGKMDCPRCGTSGASEKNGQIQCPNPGCAYFVADSGVRIALTTPDPDRQPGGSFNSGRQVEIRYKNFVGQERVFRADAATAVRRNRHIVVAVAPKGVKISLSLDRITNLSSIEGSLPPGVASEQAGPTPRERQILGYHKRHRSRSALYDSIRNKYPEW